MEFDLIALLSLSIIIPAIIGLIRFSKINEAYHPFIYCIWIGTLNEVISIMLAKAIHTTNVNVNIYMLLESLLLAWQFEKWRLFERKAFWFKATLIALVSAWLIENFIYSDIFTFNSYFSIFYSTIITFFSISMLNQQIVRERRSLLKNPIFILCIGFVMYYTYHVLAETFLIYGIRGSSRFWANVYTISVITNFISIILYTLSIVWMPTKHRFTLPSS